MTVQLRESSFRVPKMDCSSEEAMIRIALEPLQCVERVHCDLARRRVRVLHHGDPAEIVTKFGTLGLGAELVGTSNVSPTHHQESDPAAQGRTLKLLLAINAAMFAAEMIVAVVAHSAGLLADSLDMFADAAVYGLALYAVGRSDTAKLRVAHSAGWVQAALAVAALLEVGRRFFFDVEPESDMMMVMAGVALLANGFSLWLVSRHRGGGVHMQASFIFSANDVLANAAVILAGALVAWTDSRYPDLAVGAAIAILVLLGARRILRLR